MENKKIKRLVYDEEKGEDVVKTLDSVQTTMDAMVYAFVEDGS